MDWRRQLQTCLTDPWAFEDDSAFREHLTTTMHTTLQWFSGLGLVLSLLYFFILLLVQVLSQGGLSSIPLTTAFRMGSAGLALVVCLGGMAAVRAKCSLTEARLFGVIALVVITLGGVPGDLMAGSIHSARLIPLYLAVVFAVPLQAWHTFGLGMTLLLLVFVGGTYGPLLNPHLSTSVPLADVLSEIVACTLLATGFTVLSLTYRYVQFRGRQTTRQALHASRSLLHRTEEMAKVGGWELQVDSEEMSWTEELYRLHAVPLTYEPDLQATIDFYAPKAQPVFQSALDRCIEEGQTFQLELPFETANGTRRWARTRGEAHVEDGETTRVTGMVHDITDRKKMEQKLQESEKRLRRAQRIAHMGNWERDLERDSLICSSEVHRVFGWPDDLDVTYETFLNAIHPDDRDQVRHARSKALDEENDLDIEYRIQRPDGEERFIHERGEVYRRDGHPVRFSGTVLDITDRKEMEQEVRESRLALSEAQKLADTGHLTIDFINNVVDLSKESSRLLGLDADTQYRVDDLIELVHPEDRDRVRYAFARMHQEPVHELEYRIQLNGSVRWMRERGRPVKDESGHTERVFGVLTDITELKTRAKERQERESKIEALYTATSRLLKATSRSEVGALIEELTLNTFDYPISSVQLLDDDQLLPIRVSPQMRQILPQPSSNHLEDGSLPSRAFGTEDTVLVTDLQDADLDADYGSLRSWVSIPLGNRGVLSIGALDPEAIDSFDIRLLEILSGHATVVLDRIERERELVRAKESAEKANELKSAFLANMSHEIRTPLTSIIGFAEAIGDATPTPVQDGDESIPRFASLIEKSGRRLLDTLNSVLDFSQLEAGSLQLQLQTIDLAAEIEETIGIYQPRATDANIDLSMNLSDNLPDVYADPEAFRRVLRNLLSNAVKFTDSGGSITVSAQAHEDEMVKIQVEDTGIGIDEEFVPHLFDAFKQESTGSKRTHEGSGLGLAVAKRLVHLMQGSINVRTEKGIGTRFTIKLPQNAPETAQVA